MAFYLWIIIGLGVAVIGFIIALIIMLAKEDGDKNAEK